MVLLCVVKFQASEGLLCRSLGVMVGDLRLDVSGLKHGMVGWMLAYDVSLVGRN